MGKSLSDYNKEHSSSTDINNITWTHKKPTEPDKSKKKNKKKISPLNIIPGTKRTKSNMQKNFIVEDTTKKLKNKTENEEKRSQQSSASICKIKQGFKRPAR